jgi:GT2 family glycosyltransferase
VAPKVNVYILHCESPNGDELLRETLLSLEAQDYEEIEITVIGNGIEPNTNHPYPDRWIRLEQNVGVAKGYNAGLYDFLGAGHSEYVLLINNDVAADPEMVSRLVETAEEGITVGIVAPRIYYYGTNKIWFDGGLFNEWTGVTRHKNIRKIGPADTKAKVTTWITGCCMLIKREVVDTIGFFDEDFSPAYGEDVDYCMRAREWGFRLMVNPKAKLYHKVSQSIGILKGKS